MDDLLIVAGVLLLAKAWDEWSKGPAEQLKDAGAKLYDQVHDDEGHRRDLPRRQLSRAAILELAELVGFPDPNMATAIALAESGGIPNALGDSGVSVGLWQINTRAHPQYNRTQLENPENNARAAYAISSAGTNWRPWSVYTSGRYLRYL